MSEDEDETPEDRLAEVEANFAFEGIFFTQEERELMLRYLRGEITREEHTALTKELIFSQSTDDGRESGA